MCQQAINLAHSMALSHTENVGIVSPLAATECDPRAVLLVDMGRAAEAATQRSKQAAMHGRNKLQLRGVCNLTATERRAWYDGIFPAYGRVVYVRQTKVCNVEAVRVPPQSMLQSCGLGTHVLCGSRCSARISEFAKLSFDDA